MKSPKLKIIGTKQKLLYRDYFKDFFRSFRTDLAFSAETISETYRSGSGDKGLAVFLKALYPSGPLVWKGLTFSNLSELADSIYSTDRIDPYIEILENNCISHWLVNTDGIKADSGILEAINDIEVFSHTEPNLSCYWFAHCFAKNKVLHICNQDVSTIEDLVKALFTSAHNFFLTDGYDKLMDKKKGVDFYGFLYSFGYKEIIESYWGNIEEQDEFSRATTLFSMLDAIAEKNASNVHLIRRFFANYGPAGIAAFIKKLVKQEGIVYCGIDSHGKEVLEKIAGFDEPDIRSANVYTGYIPLFKIIDEMYSVLIDNPFCIMAGVYESTGIICKNLVGCFAFEIFGRRAPLGFSTWIETDGGRRQ